jgi:hypothetical protein
MVEIGSRFTEEALGKSSEGNHEQPTNQGVDVVNSCKRLGSVSLKINTQHTP